MILFECVTNRRESAVARGKHIGLRKQLTSVISRRRIDQLAQDAGLVQRHRKVTAVDLFWTLVLGFGGAGVRMLAGLRRAYVTSTGITLTASAFYKRFTPRLTALLRSVLGEIAAAAQVADTRLQGILRSFKDVLIVDSTLVKLHDLLEKEFPGTRKNSAKASAKLSIVMSVKSQGPHSVKVTSGRRNDRRVLQVGRWVADRLMLLDLGYFHYQLFDCIDRNKGWFVTRLKDNANPLITRLLRLCRGASVPIVGEWLRSVADRLQR